MDEFEDQWSFNSGFLQSKNLYTEPTKKWSLKSVLGCFCNNCSTYLNTTLQILVVILLIVVMVQVHHYKDTVEEAKTLGHNISKFMYNITDLKKDISVYSDLVMVLVEHKHEIHHFFDFINITENFIEDAKRCVNHYDICPSIK